MKPKLLFFLFVLIIASTLLFFVSASALDGVSLDWWTVDNGSAIYSEGGSYSLAGSLGQSDGGVSRGGDYALFGGFWGGGQIATHDLIQVYLPLVLH